MSAQPPYAGLELDTWRQLLAQSALLQAAAPFLGDFHDAAIAGGVAHMAHSGIAPACRSAAAVASTDQAALTQATATWHLDLDRAIELGKASSDPDVPLLCSIRGAVTSPVLDDHIAVTFDKVMSRAAGVYGDGWVQPRLELGWFPHPPRPAPDPYPLAALTAPGPQPVVEVNIHLDGLLPAAYAALPAVLIHEAICHVPARPVGVVCNRSPFAEGFMDYAAQHFFDNWIPYIDPDLAPAAIEHARRMDLAFTDPGGSGAPRLAGRRAARRLATWLVNHRGAAPAEAEVSVAALALGLNVVDAPLDMKDLFTVRVADHSWPNGLEASLDDVLATRAPAIALL